MGGRTTLTREDPRSLRDSQIPDAEPFSPSQVAFISQRMT